MIDPVEFDFCVSKMREFFKNEKLLKFILKLVLSIIPACEDPKTISTYDYAGEVWPFPQTGQMWLEYEILILIQIKKEIW